MTEQTLEQLSALMDGELKRDAVRFLLRRAEGENALMQQRWSSYHMVRTCLRHQTDPITVDLAQAVMACIENEKLVSGQRLGLWTRWVSGGAIAAAVALGALVIVPSGRISSGSTANVETNQRIEPITETREFPVQLLTPTLSANTASFDYSQAVSPYETRLGAYIPRRYDANGFEINHAPYILLVAPMHTKTPLPADSYQKGTTQP